MSEMSGTPQKKNPFAKKSLGQNFLVDKGAIAKIVGSVPTSTELLLEIGPGRGALSTELFSRAKKFCVLEKDDLFAKEISETLFVHGSRSHTVFHFDALSFDWNKIWSDTESSMDTPLVVASNLPYNVATEILFRLLDLSDRIPLMVLMFQKEVALRIAAECGGRAYGGISVAAQNEYEVKIQQILKPGAFRPSPKVDSAVLEFHRREKPIVSFSDSTEKARFKRLVQASFAHKRKTIENSLSMESGKLPWQNLNKIKIQEVLNSAQIPGIRRAETVAIEEFGRLFQQFEKNKG